MAVRTVNTLYISKHVVTGRQYMRIEGVSLTRVEVMMPVMFTLLKSSVRVNDGLITVLCCSCQSYLPLSADYICLFIYNGLHRSIIEM